MKALVIIILVLCACCAQGRDYQQALRVLSTVESGGNTNAVGDATKAVGIFQIQPVQVYEVNRLLGYPRFKLADRLDRVKSETMCLIFLAWESGRRPKDSTVRWLCRWRNPLDRKPPPGWYLKRINNAIGVDMRLQAASAKGALTQRLNAWRTMNRSDYHVAKVETKEIK
jgi:hypothetical protein